MSVTLSAARSYTADLAERARQCGNGEGFECMTIEGKIKRQVELSSALLNYVRGWAKEIFAGKADASPEVESLLKGQITAMLLRVGRVAAEGRSHCEACGPLAGLDDLHWHISNFEYMLRNWVTPKLAVAPGPRVSVPDAAANEIRESLRVLSDRA